jgi:hypothetical protein
VTVRPDDLRGAARDSYDTWRSIGLSESAAMNALVEDGVITLSEEERQARMFSDVFGLSEAEARRAAAGRDGCRTASGLVSEALGRSAAVPHPGDALRLVAKIEELAASVRGRGGSFEEAVKAAVWTVFEAAPDEASQDWVAAVAHRRWPWLPSSPGSSGTVRGE